MNEEIPTFGRLGISGRLGIFGRLSLERAAGAQAAEAEQWLGAYDRLCHGVLELGETEDWLHHMEAQMRTLSVELEHVHRQLEFAHDRRTPA